MVINPGSGGRSYTRGKKRQKKLEVQKARLRGTAPFARFDLFGDGSFSEEMDMFFHEYLPRRWWQQVNLGWPGRSAKRTMEPFLGKTPSVDILELVVPKVKKAKRTTVKVD